MGVYFTAATQKHDDFREEKGDVLILVKIKMSPWI